LKDKLRGTFAATGLDIVHPLKKLLINLVFSAAALYSAKQSCLQNFFLCVTQHKDTQHKYIEHNDTQHKEIEHNDTQLKDIQRNDTLHKGLICDAQNKGHSA
jgi:hypothetical protein